MARLMSALLGQLQSRVLPALLTAAGITLVAAGLMNLGQAADAGVPSPAPATQSVTQTPAGSSPSATAAPATASIAPGSPSPGQSTAAGRVATRVVVPALAIDLPIVAPTGGPNAYPLCNVAMFIQELKQPGEPGATYVYAHARTGMFLPLLDASKVNNGASLVGMLVQVYTSDDRLFLYEITQVRRHQLTLADPMAATDSQLWLQTSEGPKGTPEKLQVVARPLSDGPADPAQAHPTPKPIVCG